jgi:Glycosyltransferase family 87
VWPLAAATAIVGLSLALAAMRRVDAPALTALRSVYDQRSARFGDVNPSLHAARRLAHDSRAPLYDATLARGSSFIYPPLAALFYRPFAGMDVEGAHRALVLVDHAVFVLIVAMLVAFVRRLSELDGMPVVAIVLAALAFYPLVRLLEINQAGLVVTLFVGGAHLAATRRWRIAAGTAFAFAGAIKPHLFLAVPLLAFAAPGLALAALATGALLLAVSIAVAGVANHVAYATVVLPALSAGYVFAPNQSWTALFGRLILDADMGEFVLAPRDLWVEVLAALTGGLVYVLTLLAIRRGGKADLVGALGLAWLAVTPISPIAWEHHYAPALFVLAWAWAGCRRVARDGWLLAVAVAYGLMGSAFAVQGLQGGVARLLASYVLFGALVIQAVGTALLWRANR